MFGDIANFFGSLFGGKKKDKKKDTPRVQQAQPVTPTIPVVKKPTSLQPVKPTVLQPKTPSITLNTGDTNKNVIKMTTPKLQTQPVQQRSLQPSTDEGNPQSVQPNLPKFAQPNTSANINQQPSTKTALTVKPTSPFSGAKPAQPKKKSNWLMDNLINPMVSDATKAASTLEIPLSGLAMGAALAQDKLFNGGKNSQNIINATGSQIDDLLKTSAVSKKVAQGKASPLEFAGDVAKTGTHYAPYFVGAGGGGITADLGENVAGKVAAKTGNSLLGKAAGEGSRVAANASVAAPVFAGIDAIDQGVNAVANGGQTGFDPVRSLESGGMAAASTVVGDVAGSALRHALPRDNGLPTVTRTAPRNVSEAKAAVDNGIVTPATKTMSVDDQVKTALNSDIGQSVRYRTRSTDYHVNHFDEIDPDRARFLISKGYVSSTDAGGNRAKLQDIASGAPINYTINDLNPTGGIVTEYNPSVRATAPLGDNITTYANTSGLSPDDMVTIYRGGPVEQRTINPGDFVTTNPQLAKDYAGDGHVISQDVPAGHILDDVTYPLGEEYLYRPNDNVRNRVGAPGDNISRSDMQNVQLENNHMFGNDAPNIEWQQGVGFVPGTNDSWIGRTEDFGRGPSKITIAMQQGDPHATYLHEAVHKALNDFVTPDERKDLLMSYAADKRITKGMSERDIEEHMAEDFIQYSASRKASEATPPPVSQRVKEIFEKVFKRLQFVTAKIMNRGDMTADYKQFYNDLYSGKYANEPVRNKATDELTAEQQQLKAHEQALQQAYDTTPNGTARKSIAQQIVDVRKQLGESIASKKADSRYREDSNRPRMTRALRAALDDVIIEDNPQLARDETLLDDAVSVGESGGSDIPRIHVDDLEHYFGKAGREDMPNRYKRTTGARDIDQLAARAGYDDIDSFVEAIHSKLDNRRVARETAEEIRELRKNPEYIKKAQQRVEETEDKALHQTSVEYITDRMPSDIRDFWNEMQRADQSGEAINPEQAARVTHWVKQNSDKLLNEYRQTRAGIYNARRGKRVAKFSEFTNSKKDAETLADMSPEEAKVEHINSRTRMLHLPGGDTATKVDVSGPRSSKVQEFAVRSNIDESGKQTIDLVPLDGEKHVLKNGTVVDKDGKSVGSYAAIDDAGNQIAYIEGKPVNITGVLGDIEQWGNLNVPLLDMDRLIELNAPDKATARRVQKFVTQFKDSQESMMKTELLQKRAKLQELERSAYKNLPRGVSKKELRADLFSITEKKANYAEVLKKYGKDYTEKYIKPTVTWWRKTADDMLSTTNSVLERNGYDEIPRLDNYITHIQADPSFWHKVGIGLQDINPMGSSIDSDINPGKTRGGIPEAIVGNTENTAARRKWNPFAQKRLGSQHERDFFKAIDSYFEPMLFNKYMTPAASRARVVERSFRMFEEAKRIREEQRVNELAEAFGATEAKKMVRDESTTRNHSRYKSNRSGPMITAWQEYGNMLAGKTNALDRLIIDKGGVVGEKVMNLTNKAQAIVGKGTIPGSASAALAQTLSIPQTIGRDGLKAFAKATKQMITMDGKRAGSNDPMLKSAFMRSRYTDASSKRGSWVQKYTHKASTFMEKIERATGELSWRSAYNTAISKGLPEKEAILQADIETKKTLAGRGIGDRPFVMNSKALGAWTQFGLEVNNMGVQFWHDFTPTQKIKFMVAAYAMNVAFGAVTGTTQLPDYIGATFDTINDFENSNDDKKDTTGDNIKQAVQRFVGETSRSIAGAAPIMSAFMSDNDRQAFFGKNSDVSRYGTPAIGKIGNLGVDVAKGDWGKLGSDALSLLPTGNQIKKTIGGINALQKGYTENSKGNIRNVYDNKNPLTDIDTALFGQYAIPGESAAADSGRALDKTQTQVFKQLYAEDPEAAKEYFNQAMGIKVMKSNRHGSLTDTGYDTNTAGAVDVASEAAIKEAQVKMKTDLESGKVVEKNGIYYTKNGGIKTSYYKDVAQGSKNQSDDTYKAYLYGYGLETGTKYDPGEAGSSTGNNAVDALEKAKDKSGTSKSLVSNAIALYKGDKKDVPDWVKDRFYKEAGWSKDDVAYASIASYNTQAKLDGYYTPLAQNSSHEDLLNTLVSGRKKSIANTMAASDAVITALQKDGYLSKSEAKYLKSVTTNTDGSTTTKSSSSSRKKSVTKDDISSYLSATGKGGTDIASLIKKYNAISFGGLSTTPRSSSPRMRSMAVASAKSGSKNTPKRRI